MLTEADLRQLMAGCEEWLLDFKAEPHRLDNEHFKSEFVKDVLAMANTPRGGTAYIVIGVKAPSGGPKEFLGVHTHPDDSDLQDKLKLAAVQPAPTFVYRSVALDGKSYGLIEIPLAHDGPYFATRDYGVLKANRLYFRRGTQNDEATVSEQGEIYRWFQRLGSTPPPLDEPTYAPSPGWDKLLLACHRFDPNRLYILVVGPARNVGKALHLVGRLPLSLVLDFDPLTEEEGAYSYAGSVLRNGRSVHLLTLEDRYALVPERACYWYAAKGLKGRAGSLVGGDWREWNRKYSVAIGKLLEDFARASAGRPVTVIALWHAPAYLRDVCGAVDRALGDAADYVFAIPEADRLADPAAQFGAETVSIGMEDVCHGIAQSIAPATAGTLYAGVPHADGSFRLIDTQDTQWLAEDLEVLHSNVELVDTEDKREVGKDFLRGAVVSWADLSNHFDADRDATEQIRRQLERELATRAAVRYNLYHWPGAGGTTVARRIAWELRRTYPTVLVKRVTAGETVGRLRKLFQLTAQPVLAIVEGADTVPDRIEQLYTEVRAEQIPVVFLFVLRKYELPQEGKRISFLGANLSLPESARFAEVYRKSAPSRTPQLQDIVSRSPLRERTPFQFALTAFGKDYTGLSRYVEARLETATQTQTEIVTFLALAYYYGHKAVLPQVLAAHLGLPENRTVQIDRVLGELQLELLVPDMDSKWRPAHQLIAEEVLHIVLSGSSEERRHWKRGLSAWSLDFVRACYKGTLQPSDDMIDLLRRMFILRDEHDLLGTEGSGSSRFARLIEDIQTSEGQLAVFKELTNAFPYEAHFWGHLGRFYSTVMDEPAEALAALNRAIDISPDDPVLHHMKGMCYRKLAYSQIREIGRQRAGASEQSLRETVERAKEAFGVARSLDASSEHAHISPIQLLLRVLDFGFGLSGCASRAEFLISPRATWYRDQLDEAEILLDQVRSLREGEKASRYVMECEAQLDQVCDNYSRALEGWNTLLTRRDVYAPPVRRQMVRAYLSRHKRDWSALDQREVERIVDLMEENMREEPASSHNLRIWLRAFRLSARQDADIALDRLATWRALGDAPEAHYYLYILHVLKAIGGSLVERVRSDELIKASRTRARNLRNRTISFEWYGQGRGLARLKHYTELGEWDDSTDFYGNTSILERVKGRIFDLDRPEAGSIELSCGLTAFFVPSRAGFYKGRDENAEVDLLLGFSYDGLRAWDVRRA
ncbi:MAG: RNA-binding domain-containing protein [Anaerolineae bacterium]